MSDDFRESLKVEPSEISSSIDEQKFAETYARNYTDLFNIPEVREYFTYVVSALSLSHYSQFRKKHELPGAKVKYRFKSFNSVAHKMKEYFHRYGSEFHPIFDGFAMTMITDILPIVPTISDSPVRYTVEDLRAKELIAQKRADDEFSKKMHEFKSRFVEDDSYTPVIYKGKTDVTQEEYYANCLELLQRTKALINPAETSIIAPLDESIALMQNKLNMVESMQTGDFIVPNSEFSDPNTNFVTYLRNFERRRDRELAITLLTREFKLLFENPRNLELFEKLGIKFSDAREQKNKRKENGYESNFVYIDTMFGTSECQLQTNGQYDQGKTGTASHAQYKISQAQEVLNESQGSDSLLTPVPIPNAQEMAIPEVKNEFLTQVKHMSPRKYKMEITRGRAEVVENGLLDNYQTLFLENPEDAPYAQQYEQYISMLESREDSPLNQFPTKIIKYYTLARIENYLLGQNFEKVKKIAELWNQHKETGDFMKAYNELFLSKDHHDSNLQNQTSHSSDSLSEGR